MLDAVSKMLEPLSKLLSGLTIRGVLLGLLFGFGVVSIGALWTMRDSIYPSMLESQAAIISVGAALALLVIGLGWDSLQHRIDARTDAVQLHLQAELTQERTERRHLYELVLTLTSEHADMKARERECLERVRASQERIQQLERRFDDSGFGRM